MMNIKVKFFREDRGECIQLYKRVPEEKGKQNWFARTETGEWYTVSDAPYGYCELNSLIKSDVTFEIVDKIGNIYFTSVEKDNIKKYPFINKKCILEWKSIENEFKASRDGFSKWICSYMDLEKYTEYRDSMSSTVWKDNWSDFYYDVESKETIKTFNYLGFTYEIVKLYCKHRVCGKRWIEYMVGEKNSNSYEYYAGWEKVIYKKGEHQ